MRILIRQYWHVLTALIAAGWLAGTAVYGWTTEVNTHIDTAMTRREANETYVRKDVQSEQLKRIEAQLQALNEQFTYFLDRVE